MKSKQVLPIISLVIATTVAMHAQQCSWETCCDNCCGNFCPDNWCDIGYVPTCHYEFGTYWLTCDGTPIVLDVSDRGFHLTSLANGVKFRTSPSGPLRQMSWTDPRWGNGWLALDRDGDGAIDNLTELFGSMTPQPPGPNPNGYLALRLFDRPENGGNGNGFIDRGDSVYDRLTVWIDSNQNGVSEPRELHSLRELGIVRIGLDYRESRRVDVYGNRFAYRAPIWDTDERRHEMCYDVVLQMEASRSPGSAARSSSK